MKGWLQWVEGRLGTGYFKMLLAASYFPLPFDLYVLKFPKGSKIDWHTDPAPAGSQHWRLNLLFKRSKKGGRFLCLKIPQLGNETSRIQLFRPDQNPHMMTPVEDGCAWVLSLGWLRKTSKKKS